MFFSILSSILQFLSFPPAELNYLALVALVPLFVFLCRETSTKRIIAGVLIYRAVFLLLVGAYIPDPLLLFFELLFFLPFISLVILLKRYPVKAPVFLFVIALAYMLSETFVARFAPLPSFVVLSGLPLAATPFIYLAKWGGVYATSVFSVFINTVFSSIFIAFQSKNRKKILFFFITVAVIFLLGVRFEKLLKPIDNNADKSIHLAVISTGEAYDDGSKIDITKEGAQVKLDNFIDKTLGDVAQKLGEYQPDLIILPEHFIDLLLLNDVNAEAREKFGIINAGTILSHYQSFAKARHSAILVSLRTYDIDHRKRQSAILIDKDGNLSAISDKYYLTVGSETWPFGKWIPFYWKYSLRFLPPETKEEAFIALSPTGQYAPAEKPFSPISFGGITIGTLLCSEGHYPLAYQELMGKGADIFISTSNNTWVSFAGDQYKKETLWLLQMYAVSTGKLIIIAGKNDLAGIIYPDGTFEGMSPQTTDSLVLFTKDIRL